jgi:mono/diheme cytochrome c family protein
MRPLACVALLAATIPAAFAGNQAQQVERGRYLVQIGGCNECHTPGYAAAGGAVPVTQWLVGSAQGYTGPWGTTYATSLRVALARVDEQQWLAFARQPRRPPMPWPSLRAMSDADLRAIYQFVRSLDRQN